MVETKTKNGLRDILLEASEELTKPETVEKRNQIAKEKSIHDASTWVDEYSEDFSINRFRRKKELFPYTIISEERKTPVVLGNDGFIYLDPLEATDNYRSGLPVYGINIGLIERGRLVYATFSDISKTPWEIFEAERGNGAFLYRGDFVNSERLHVNDGNRRVAFNQWEDVDEDVIGENYAKLLRFTRRVSTTYSDSGDLCNVACGRFGGVVFIYRKAAPWDMVMALAIEEAGGKITDLDGNHWDKYDNLGRLLVGNGLIGGGEYIYGELIKCRFSLRKAA